jgi:NAD dependent epimerase/dehydratase family enzyme
MNVFLTGATGYIGRVIAEQLQHTGHTVNSQTSATKAQQQLNWQPQASSLSALI